MDIAAIDFIFVLVVLSHKHCTRMRGGANQWPCCLPGEVHPLSPQGTPGRPQHHDGTVNCREQGGFCVYMCECWCACVCVCLKVVVLFILGMLLLFCFRFVLAGKRARVVVDVIGLFDVAFVMGVIACL